MYICKKCGKLVETVPTYTVPMRAADRTFYEKECSYGCMCGGEFVEADQCQECGAYILPDETMNSLCVDCFDRKYTPEFALECDNHDFLDFVYGDEAYRILTAAFRKKPADERKAFARAYYREVL